VSSSPGRSPLRIAVAACAALAVVCLVLLVLPHGELVCSAAVDSSRSFSLESIEPGRYQWSLRDGRTPGGQGLEQQRVLYFERSDLVEMELPAEITSGRQVAAGEVVAWVRSLGTAHRLAQLQAQRAALGAQRALLVAGGAPEGVAEAERAVELAEAERDAGRAELNRTRILAEQGLASAEELEAAELQDEVHRLRIALAIAGVAVASGPVRQESLVELDARLAAVDAGIDELSRLRQEEQVLSPIDGTAEVAGPSTVLRIHDLQPAYLEIPIPADSVQRVQTGAPVLFTTPAIPDEVFEGVLEQLAESPSVVQGQSVFWASARVDNGGRRLRFGLTGTARLPLDVEDFSVLASFRHRLRRLGR